MIEAADEGLSDGIATVEERFHGAGACDRLCGSMKAFRVFAALLLWTAAVGGAEVRITLLDTTDLHAHILPATNYEGKTDVGGAARCAWMIRKIRSQEKNV